MDLYLLDHVLKGRMEGRTRVLDAGCGEGRNLTFFARESYDVYAMDREPMAVKMCQMRFSDYPTDHFRCGPLTEIPWENGFFDLVISSAVLHFAISGEEFLQLWREHTRVTASGGLLFLRMASLWGGVKPGEFSFYLDDKILEEMLALGWRKAEPVKTVLVEKERSMASLLLERR